MEKHHGTIDVEIAQEILADHYDVYLKKENNPCSRTVEGHYELDPFEYWGARVPYQPAGAVDGKVMDSDMAKDLSFWARWGSSTVCPLMQKSSWLSISSGLTWRVTSRIGQLNPGPYLK